MEGVIMGTLSSNPSSTDLPKQGEATEEPERSGSRLTRVMSRRGMLGAAALSAAGLAGFAATVGAPIADANPTINLTEYYSILATGEALFTTFYALGVQNHRRLGFWGEDLNGLQAIAAAEEIHYEFAKSQGGTPATLTFSFPHGQATFQNRKLYLETMELAETLTSGALLAWILDMANAGYNRLAQLGGQLMQVEGGHRLFARVLRGEDRLGLPFGGEPGAEPFPNWAFAPVVLSSFTQVPAVVTQAGFLTPTDGNSFPYTPYADTFPGLINTDPGSLT